MKSGILLLLCIIILIIVVRSKSNSSTPSTTTTDIPIVSNFLSTLSLPKPNNVLVPSVASIKPIGILPSVKLNPNLVKFGGGVTTVNGTTNLLYQERDPLPAQEPPTQIVTSDLADTSQIDQTLVKTLPSGNTRRLPAVSLGPSVASQAQNLIDFFRTDWTVTGGLGNGSDRGGQPVDFSSGRVVEGFV